jgi:hypothetical protein
VNLDAILADAQTGTPDPRPAGPFADPAHEARARAWDELVERVARGMFPADWGLSIGLDLWRRDLAAAALKVIQAERAGEAEGEWEWGFRWPEWSDNVDSRWVDSEWQARALVAEVPGRVLVRRIPAGRWEPAPAEGGA